ncbi:MAG: hypothetical protein K8T90_04795 [Planctomycetes bacterium]|nr:hypothetical protein [Planctomycetota bacterium]
MTPKRRRVLVVLACCAAIAVGGVAVSAIPPTYPDPPLRFWAWRPASDFPNYGEDVEPGIYADRGGPVVSGLEQVYVLSTRELPPTVFRPETAWNRLLRRIDHDWADRLGGDLSLYEVHRIDCVEVESETDEPAAWLSFTRVTDDLPDGAVPRADLVGTWQEESENQAWDLRADGTLDRKWRVSLSSGTWGEIDGLVFLRPAGQRCQVRVLLPGRTSWRDGYARFVAERR